VELVLFFPKKGQLHSLNGQNSTNLSASLATNVNFFLLKEAALTTEQLLTFSTKVQRRVYKNRLGSAVKAG